ncbi:MAG: hypothetical protein ABW217_14115 [Polyangiaceae bacterium]
MSNDVRAWQRAAGSWFEATITVDAFRELERAALKSCRALLLRVLARRAG